MIRLGISHGEFHWHKHNDEDECFYVVEGRLIVDLENRSVELNPRQDCWRRRECYQKTRAPERTIILMKEGSGVKPTGS